MELDTKATKAAMLRLEDQSDDPRAEVPVINVIAKLLGVEPTEELAELVGREAQRTVVLVREHYSQFTAPTPEVIAGLGITQGITLAKAVREVELEIIGEEDHSDLFEARFSESERENAQRALTQTKPKLSTDEAAEIVDIVLLAASR